jgi:hypothetical protein
MRKNERSLLFVASLLCLAMGLAGCSGSTGEGSSAGKGGIFSKLTESTKPVTIPEGTAISVSLDQTLSSKGNHSGDEFEATVSAPVMIQGKTVVPKDAHAKGRVVNAVESGRLQTPAELSIELTSVEVGGTWKDLQTSPVSLRGKSHKTRDIEMIGGGSALGAVVGAIAGGGKGAAIGAAAGAGAGTATAAATGKKEVSFPAESRVSFRLRQPVTVDVKG